MELSLVTLIRDMILKGKGPLSRSHSVIRSFYDKCMDSDGEGFMSAEMFRRCFWDILERFVIECPPYAALLW